VRRRLIKKELLELGQFAWMLTVLMPLVKNMILKFKEQIKAQILIGQDTIPA
jgi:hypothetical protein